MTLKRASTTALLIAAAVAGLVLTAPMSAATTDETPPVWTKVPTASVPIGATLNLNSDADCAFHRLSPVNIDYAAADPESGIDRYEWSDVAHSGVFYSGLATRSVWYAASMDEADCYGGGRNTWRTFQAFNGAGLPSASYTWTSDYMGVREDAPAGEVPGDYSQPIPGGLSYSGTWATSACTCWSGGTTQKTRQSGASVTLRMDLPNIPMIDVPPETTWVVALVMAKGPDRGKAAVFVDSVRVATVDTYSATSVNRTVVWRQPMTNAAHTVRIVNLGTAGRPRIDIDAFVAVPR